MPSFFYMSQPTLVLFLKKSEIYSRQTPRAETPLLSRGGESRRGSGGWGGDGQQNHSLDQHHFLRLPATALALPAPLRGLKVASQLFLCRAATPPHLRRGVLLFKLQNDPLPTDERFSPVVCGPCAHVLGVITITGLTPARVVVSTLRFPQKIRSLAELCGLLFVDRPVTIGRRLSCSHSKLTGRCIRLMSSRRHLCCG